MKSLELLAIALVFVSTSAIAQTSISPNQCFHREAVESILTGKYGEIPRNQGFTTEGKLAEMWSNLGTGTWTFTISATDEIVCLVQSGNGYKNIPAVPNL